MKSLATSHRDNSVWFMSIVVLLGVTMMLSTARSKVASFEPPSLLGSTVTVETVSHVFADHAGNSVWTMDTGSGLLVSSERCEVWTNHHVIENAAFIEVRVHGDTVSRSVQARVVGSIGVPDVAVLELERCDGIAEARLGNSDLVRTGDTAYAVGNPFGANPNTVTRGIVSHTRRYVDGTSAYLQTDAAIGLGSSGGPLFNQIGEVIGINVGVAGGGARGDSDFGYAIPINEAARAIKEIVTGTLIQSDTGLLALTQNIDAPSAEMLGVRDGQGAVVVARTPTQGPAAGRVFARDVVLRLDDKSVHNTKHFERMLAAHRPGDRLRVAVIRNGREVVAEIEAAAVQSSRQTQALGTYEDLLGLELAYWGEESGELGQYKHPVITHLYDLGPAHRARVRASRRSARAYGPVLARLLLDVQMVTGAVLDGEYIPITNKLTLDRIAARAHDLAIPILLEVSSWRPENPNRPGAGMSLHGSTLHRIMPARASAAGESLDVDTTDSKKPRGAGGEV